MLLKLENVQKHYKQFDLNCSLEVQEGYVTGLIGRNGSGKSTTFKAILDLIQIDGGEIEVFGRQPRLLQNKEKERIGVVLAESGFSGYLTVSDVASMLNGLYGEFDKEAFVKKCKQFDIPMQKKIKDFSTGMKAKLKVLAAMSHEAKLLILDEPTAGLDVIAREEILDMLREYMESGDKSILISSHISSDLEGLCDDFYMIEDGKVILHEETDVLLDAYGVLKVTEEQYQNLEKQYLLRKKKEEFGYRCLTNEKQFYLENYPQITVEKAAIDEMITLVVRGEEI